MKVIGSLFRMEISHLVSTSICQLFVSILKITANNQTQRIQQSICTIKRQSSVKRQKTTDLFALFSTLIQKQNILAQTFEF
ncbi:hypothetical protein M3Y97_00412100 [Aphelenchoides bicaudatus]|nr:hypothetical protein M3Y97_00412100 [Aphelenchoides bicaudatus]